MSINNAKLILSPPIQQNIIDPATRMPVVGSVYFYKAGTSILKSVYQRSNDPDNPYVAAPNPLHLNSAGALPFSIFAYPVNEADETTLELYDLVVKNSNNVEVLRINNWPETAKQGSTTVNIADDYIVNGQFNYPIKFYTDLQKVGQVSLASTGVCPAWQYESDADLTQTERFVTFEEILNDKENDLPKFLCIIDGIDKSGKETYSHLKQRLGPVEILAGKEITFSFYGQDRNGNGAQVELYLRRIYGPTSSGASAVDDKLIDTVTVTSTLSKFTKTITVPSLEGKTIHEPSSLEFYFSFPIGDAYKIGVTSVVGRFGNIDDPVFNVLPVSLLNARIFGESIDYQNRSTADNFGTFGYFNGDTVIQRNTGHYIKVAKRALRQDMEILGTTRKALPVKGANDYGIPYENLFNVLKTDWGTDGDLVVTQDKEDMIFEAIDVGDPLNGYDKGYDKGSTSFTVTVERKASRFGIVATVSGNTLILKPADNKKPGPGRFYDGAATKPPYAAFGYKGQGGAQPIASNNIITSCSSKYTINTGGSGTTESKVVGTGAIDIVDNSTGKDWQSTLTFKKSEAAAYQSHPRSPSLQRGQANFYYTENAIGFGTNSYNLGLSYSHGGGGQTVGPFQPNQLFVYWKLDGAGGYYNNGFPAKDAPIAEVDLAKTDTLPNILEKTADAISSKFKIKITVTEVPKAGSYILFSSAVTAQSKGIQFYSYCKVDGTGTDPKPTGATLAGIAELNSNDSLETIAKEWAKAIGSANFNIPSMKDIGMELAAAEAKLNYVVVLL